MIKESLVNAISSLSKKHQIHTSELRIRISKKEDSLKYEIMKNKKRRRAFSFRDLSQGFHAF